MPSKRILDIYGRFRRLKRDRHRIGRDQYLKELQLLKLDLDAQIGEASMKEIDLSGLISLLNSQAD